MKIKKISTSFEIEYPVPQTLTPSSSKTVRDREKYVYLTLKALIEREKKTSKSDEK